MEMLLKVLTDVALPIILAIISSSWFASKITSKRMKSDEILEKLSAIDYKVDLVKTENNRARVLRFAGEIRRGVHHDLEEFNDVLLCIKSYEDFCKSHPSYSNNRCSLAVQLIEDTYQKAYKENDF